MEALCYLNGRILPISEARIDPLDRGFLFGDSLYEVIKVRSSRSLGLEAHLQRLTHSLELTAVAKPEGLADACNRLVADIGLETGFLYVQVTRGVAPRNHLPPPSLKPTVFILASEFSYDAPASRRMRVVSVPDRRWGRCDLKTNSLMATVLDKIAAEESGSDEIVFFGERGELRECGQTNFFARRDDRLETHPLGPQILPGVTRELICGFAQRLGFEVLERAPRLDEHSDWQEAFVSGTLTGVQSVAELDGHSIADGATGSWTRRLADSLERYETEQLARLDHDDRRLLSHTT